MDINTLMNGSSNDSKLNLTNRKHLAKLKKELYNRNMKYTESSIDFVLNSLDRSFEDTVEYSDENLKTIYQCGIPSHDREDALELMRELRESGITYREQHQLIVYILKHDHFFMDGQSRKNYLNLIAALALK